MGAPNAVTGATAMCSFGVAPSALLPNPATTVLIGGRPALRVLDSLPMANVPPFGMCLSLANPTVAAATAAALGVLTPMPCVPAIVTPWTPNAPTTLVCGSPALVTGATCQCAYGGVVTLTVPGQVQTLSG